MRKLRTFATIVALTGAIGLLGSSPARAQTQGFTITFPQQLLRGTVDGAAVLGPPQSTGALAGATCTVSAEDNNNVSVHQNDLQISSGGQTVTVTDIEGAVGPGGVKPASGPLTLGPDVTVSVVFRNTDASDNGAIDPSTGNTFPPNTGTFSAQINVYFECQSIVTTTTTTTTPTTTTTTTTTPTTTTTTGPTTTPPPGQIAFDLLGPVCISNFPFINYSIVGDVPDDATATLTITDTNGDLVQVLTGQPLVGQIIWPGASVDPPDWPGWKLNADGVWVEDTSDDVLREDLTITASVNPTTAETVSYPPATSACADPPPNPTTSTTATSVAPSTTPPPTLPVTGSSEDSTTNGLLLGILLLSAGGSILLAVRRRAT
jgi:hypothetical protein